MIIVITSAIGWIPIPRSHIDKRRMIARWPNDVRWSVVIGWSVVGRTVIRWPIIVGWLDGPMRAINWSQIVFIARLRDRLYRGFHLRLCRQTCCSQQAENGGDHDPDASHKAFPHGWSTEALIFKFSSP
ncbi:hypothetical protein SN10_03020 [Vibrio harveyi]|nr:hypothetical protein SN10_03020 [Vibrio harveyi]